MLPVGRFEPAIDAHGGDITIGAADGAIARGRERMGESGPGDEAAGGAEDAAGFGVVDREGRDLIVAGVGVRESLRSAATY